MFQSGPGPQDIYREHTEHKSPCGTLNLPHSSMTQLVAGKKYDLTTSWSRARYRGDGFSTTIPKPAGSAVSSGRHEEAVCASVGSEQGGSGVGTCVAGVVRDDEQYQCNLKVVGTRRESGKIGETSFEKFEIRSKTSGPPLNVQLFRLDHVFCVLQYPAKAHMLRHFRVSSRR